METVILSGEKKPDMNLIVEMAKKLGIKTRRLSLEDVEDIGLLRAIKQGETGEYIDADEFVDSLRQK